MINRNNYEEYLLMYLDGELSPGDSKAVELFLKDNPDLEEELALLKQTLLVPEEKIVFSGKESLYKKEQGISLGNYSEYFFLYIDNELDAGERTAVETFVLQHPQLQDEFTLLKQTVLPAEQIVFTNKAVLYRKEEKRRPVVVISLRWASLAAAVMIGLVALLIFNNDDEIKPMAGTPGKEVTPTVTPGKVQPGNTSTEQPANNTVIAAGNNENTSNKNIAQPLKVQTTDKDVQEPVIAHNYQPQDQQAPVLTGITNPVANAGDPVVTPSLSPDPGTKATNTVEPAVDNNTNTYVQPVVYTEELDTDKDKSLYVGALEVNPDKVRGFFRKATRFLSNKVKNKEDENTNGKLKIANMEVNKIK